MIIVRDHTDLYTRIISRGSQRNGRLGGELKRPRSMLRLKIRPSWRLRNGLGDQPSLILQFILQNDKAASKAALPFGVPNQHRIINSRIA